MEKLSREFNQLIQHLTKSMHSNLRVWKSLKRCLKAESFNTPFGVDEASNQVWTLTKMGFKLDMPLSNHSGNIAFKDRDFIFLEIYSNLDPPWLI